MALIEVCNLVKTYLEAASPVHVLDGVNMQVESGRMVGITGESGAGKTTLLYLLGALERPTSGNVLFDGREVFPPGIDDRELAQFRNRRIGFVFQFHGLIPEFDVLENTMMPALIAGHPRDHAARMARRSLEELGLGERLDHKPGEISGGEQQRVAFARAMIMQPEVVLADEPPGTLDEETSEKLWQVMFDINQSKGTTFVVVTHNERLAKRMDCIYRLSLGHVERIA